MNEIIYHNYSENINLNELNYREEIQPLEETYKNKSHWLSVIDSKLKIFSDLINFIDFNGTVLELGAGSAWFSCEMSKVEKVEKVYSLDMSKYILENITPQVIKHLNAKEEKIYRVVGDFSNLNFENIDFVIFDGAMHHIPEEQFGQVLSEINKVLKPNGKLVAIFEPFLGSNKLINKVRKHYFGLHERKQGVTENIFTKKEWDFFFESAGFKANYIPYIYNSEKKGIKSALKVFIKKYLSGLFPNYIIVLEKKI